MTDQASSETKPESIEERIMHQRNMPWDEYLRDKCTPEEQAAIYCYAMKLLHNPRTVNDVLETELRILAERANELIRSSLV